MLYYTKINIDISKLAKYHQDRIDLKQMREKSVREICDKFDVDIVFKKKFANVTELSRVTK